MINEMNVSEEPDIFKKLQKYLQDTFGITIVESMTIIGKVHKLIRKEVKEIQKPKNPSVDFSTMTDEEICGLLDYDIL